MGLPATDVASDLAHVLWVGGAPDAGKTTVAGLLAERRRWQWYHCDSHSQNHIERSDATQLPEVYAKFGKSIDERWVHPTPEELLRSIVAINDERFPLILDDLRTMATRPLILAEGPSLHPKLIAPLLASRLQAVWLVPTEEFALASVARRDKLRGSNQASDRERYRRNVIERNRLFAEYIRREAAALGVALIEVNGTIHPIQWVRKDKAARSPGRRTTHPSPRRVPTAVGGASRRAAASPQPKSLGFGAPHHEEATMPHSTPRRAISSHPRRLHASQGEEDEKVKNVKTNLLFAALAPLTSS